MDSPRPDPSSLRHAAACRPRTSRTAPRSRGVRMLGYALALVGASAGGGCAAWAHTSSPWEFGGGVRVAPGLWSLDEETTLHPVAGYTYLSFDGGHDGLWEAGAQVRRSTALLGPDRDAWIGAEGTLSVLRTRYSFNGMDVTESATGLSATALFGVPVGGENRWGPNLYGGAGFSHYGAFGFNVRVGLDLQPWFLQRD